MFSDYCVNEAVSQTHTIPPPQHPVCTLGLHRPGAGSLVSLRWLPGSPLTGLKGYGEVLWLRLMWFPFVWPGPYFPLRLIPRCSHRRPSASLICWTALGGEASSLGLCPMINTELVLTSARAGGKAAAWLVIEAARCVTDFALHRVVFHVKSVSWTSPEQ